jgi:hypothetical protein
MEVHLKLHFIGVNFLDDQLRCYLDYRFIEKSPGMLFLSEAIFTAYTPTTDTVAKVQIVRFKTDGLATIEIDDRIAGAHLSRTTHVDVSSNWESIPQFGHYETISRIERSTRHDVGPAAGAL